MTTPTPTAPLLGPEALKAGVEAVERFLEEEHPEELRRTEITAIVVAAAAHYVHAAAESVSEETP